MLAGEAALDEKSKATTDEETVKDDVTRSPSWTYGSGQRMSVSERAERLSRLISNRQCRCSRYEKETNGVMKFVKPIIRNFKSINKSILIPCYLFNIFKL